MDVNMFLVQLGHVSDQVAYTLHTMNVKGIVRSERFCPIVNVLANAFQNMPWHRFRIVGGFQIANDWIYYPIVDNIFTHDVVLPHAVMNFMGNFDSGLYSPLETKHVTEERMRSW